MTLDAIVMIGSGAISLSIIFYGHSITKGLADLRKDFNDYKVYTEHRLSVVEVKQNEICRNSARSNP